VRPWQDLRALACEITATEQRERKRLSKILHDGLQQYLVAAKLQIAGIGENRHDADCVQTVRQIELLLTESIQISRSLSAELYPPVLKTGGLLMEWPGCSAGCARSTALRRS
jgi:signal transduction histidine kinase